MSQPPFPYNRIFDFESFSIVNPTTQQPGVQIEGELDAIKRTLDSTISRLSEIQRDDGFLRDSALDHTTVVTQLYNRLATLFSPTFLQIDQKIDLKSNIASPTFTGVVTIPANAVIVGFAKLASPDFTGVPTTPTPAVLSASQQIANAAFVTAADAVIKQWVIDNYLKLAGDRMDDNAVINWTSIVPATQYPAFYRNTDTNDISKDGVSLFGKYPKPFSAAMYSVTNRRETIVSQGSIELLEFTTPGVYPVGTPDTDAIWTEKGKIVIWSGESYDAFTTKTPRVNPLSGPHISFEDKDSFQLGLVPMIISSNGLQFPDGTYQSTRGLNIGEVQTQATNAANLAVTNLINGAPAALDTLKEIADSLANDADLAGTLTLAIAGKSDLGHTHAVSDISGLQDTLNNISLKEYDNFKTYVAGDVVLASNRIFKFNSTVGAAGYGPITHPSYWTEQSASASLAGYATETFVTSRGYITSSALSGYATESFVFNQNFITSTGLGLGYKDYLELNPVVGGNAIVSAIDGWTQLPVEFTVYTQNALAKWDGWTVVFHIASGRALNEYDLVSPKTIIVYLGDGSTTLQAWGTNFIELDGVGSFSGMVITIPNPSPYISVSVLNGVSTSLSLPLVTGNSFVYKEGLKSAFIENLSSLILNEDFYYKTIVSVSKNELAAVRVATFTELDSKFNKTGGTLTGKLNLAAPTVSGSSLNLGVGTAPTTSVAGDIWIGANINYKASDGVSKAVANTNTGNTFTQGQQISVSTSVAINPALRICQTGTAAALVVEDSTTPDTSSFVVNADGNVGIGVSSGYTATQKVEVVGNIKANGFVNGSGPVFAVNSVASPHGGGANTHDIFMSVNGSTYRIPAIFVSTP